MYCTHFIMCRFICHIQSAVCKLYVSIRVRLCVCIVCSPAHVDATEQPFGMHGLPENSAVMEV